MTIALLALLYAGIMLVAIAAGFVFGLLFDYFMEWEG